MGEIGAAIILPSPPAPNGWDQSQINLLVNWCISWEQYERILFNLSRDNWEELKTDFTADELPAGVADAWMTYKSSLQTAKEMLSQGWKGYKGSGGTEWNQGTDDSDWSGCYIRTSLEQSEGYIEVDGGTGKASLWKLTLTIDLPLMAARGGFIAQGNIPGEFKAFVLKKLWKIDVSENLIPFLAKGQSPFAYIGSGGESGDEIAVPWVMVDEYFDKRRIKEYQIIDYVIKPSSDV